MKRGALRLRKCPWSTPNTTGVALSSSLVTDGLMCELLVSSDRIFPLCLTRVLGAHVNSNCLLFPQIHLTFSLPYVFFVLFPLAGMLFPYPLNIQILSTCRPPVLWTPLLGSFFWSPPLSLMVMAVFIPCVWCLSHLFTGIRTDWHIFSSVTGLQTSGGNGPGFTHLPVLHAQRHVPTRLPIKIAIAAMIHTVCARLHLPFEPPNSPSDRY